MLHATKIPLPASIEALTIPERMALVIRQFAREGQPTTRENFHQAFETCDLTDAELDAHIGAAKRLVHPEIVRHDQPPTPVHPWAHDPEYRRERVARGAALVTGMLPDAGAINTTLRQAGFSTREVGELWPEIIAAAARSFRAAHGVS